MGQDGRTMPALSIYGSNQTLLDKHYPTRLATQSNGGPCKFIQQKIYCESDCTTKIESPSYMAPVFAEFTRNQLTWHDFTVYAKGKPTGCWKNIN